MYTLKAKAMDVPAWGYSIYNDRLKMENKIHLWFQTKLYRRLIKYSDFYLIYEQQRQAVGVYIETWI